MIKKNEAKDMIISMKKIIDILMQYWWILAITVTIMVVGVLAKGRTAIEEEVEAQSVVLMSVQAEDLVGEEYLENLIIDGRNEYTTSQNIANEVLTLYSTDKIQQKIVTKMEEKGFSNCSAGEASVQLEEATRIITISAKGNDIQKNVALVNVIAEELVSIASDELKLPGARILSWAQAQQDEVAVNMTYFTKANFALVVLGGVIGVIILGLIVVFDKRIRSREEIDWCYEGTYIGKIDAKKEQITGSRVLNSVQGILDKQGLETADIVSLQKETLENVMGSKFSYASDVLNNVEEFETLKNSKGVILCIKLKKDKFSDLDELVYTLNNMNVPVLGYILKK